MNVTDTLPNPAKARDYFSDKMEFTTGPVELKRAIDNGEVVVVDVRAPEDYAKAHIPGAINLPHDQWENPTGLRRDKTNVLYCYSQVCHLAATAAIGLAEDGYPVRELEGGFAGWKDNGLPMEGSEGAKAKATAPTRVQAGPGRVAPPSPAERSPKQENL